MQTFLILYRGKCGIAYYSGDVEVRVYTYDNYRPSLHLFTFSGVPIATATVNLPNEVLAFDEVAIKNYSENVGMLAFLQSARIVENRVERFVASGFVNIPIVKLTLATQSKLIREDI